MLTEQNKDKRPELFSLIISKSKLFTFSFTALTIIISYYFSLHYVRGDQVHYTNFYNDIRNVDIITAFILYRGYLGASEPIYFIIVYFVSGFIEKNIFMSLINGILMYYISKIMISQKISKLLIFSLIFNFYFVVLFLSAERLKFSVLFFVLFLYYFQKKKTRILFLIFSILSHAQVIFLAISAYIIKIYHAVSNVFINLKIKKSSYTLPILAVLVIILFFMKDHIINKIVSYTEDGFNIFDIIKPIVFMFFTLLLYRKDFFKIILMFFPMILGSFLFGESRIVIFAYFLFLFLSFRRSPKINIFIIITSAYFTYKGVYFLKDVMLYGTGFT